jgi:putative flippase GtrA
MTTTGTGSRTAPAGRGFPRELAAFGVVGGVGWLVDVGVFNLLLFAGEPGLLEDRPLTAKVASVAVATLVTFAGNRHWTWRHRAGRRARSAIVLFAAVNVTGMLLALGCLALSHHVLGLTSPLADNISANGVGLVLATAFRFWAYRTHVFRPVPTTGGSPGSD